MRFFLLHTRAPDTAPATRHDAAVDDATAIAMADLLGTMTLAGVLLDGNCLESSPDVLRIAVRDGVRSVRDVSADRVVSTLGGYCTIEVASRDEAIAWASRIAAVIGDGEIELRELRECEAPDDRLVSRAA